MGFMPSWQPSTLCFDSLSFHSCIVVSCRINLLSLSFACRLVDYQSTNYISLEAQLRRNVYWSGASVCLSVRLCICLSVPRRIPTLLPDPDVTYGNGRECLLSTIGQICNRCTGFVAITTQLRTRNVSECLYSLYACFLQSTNFSRLIDQSINRAQLYCIAFTRQSLLLYCTLESPHSRSLRQLQQHFS